LTSRDAVAMCDGLLGPSHRFRKSRNVKSPAVFKSTLLRIGFRGDT
jgi:hypothetical protein